MKLSSTQIFWLKIAAILGVSFSIYTAFLPLMQQGDAARLVQEKRIAAACARAASSSVSDPSRPSKVACDESPKYAALGVGLKLLLWAL